MTFEFISLLRNVGQFDSVDAGAKIPLTKLSLIYAENGRGKTTLAAILRSLSSSNPGLINERQRLGSLHPPHIVLTFAGQSLIFKDGTWTTPLPQIAVFDDTFVAENVCSGIAIEPKHRQNLHELILGAPGVKLNATLQGHIAAIEEHNRALRVKSEAIPSAARGTLTVDAFCALKADPDIEAKIQEAERSLSAAKSADAIRQRPDFAPLSLPAFDTAAIDALLARDLTDLEGEAAARVQAHLQSLGLGGETWIGDGITRIASASSRYDHEVCPFCAQDLGASPLIRHYQAYFSKAYEELKAAIKQVIQEMGAAHGGDVPAAFERAVRVAGENRAFWRAFIDVPDIEVDTAATARAWGTAREAVLTVLQAKAAAPLETLTLSSKALATIAAYDIHRTAIADLSAALQGRNAAIAIVKERADNANVTTLTADLERLVAIRNRHIPANSAPCDDYTREKLAKSKAEKLRDKARADLGDYRRDIFPAYKTAINEYLRRFNAGFRLGDVTSVNTKAGSSAVYNVLINNFPVSLTAGSGPSFRNTMSAGDRNTLALAFFFSSLDQDAFLAQKIVVIDDPITSLDEHRSLTTVHEMQQLCGRISQMIVLSHSKAFLCAIWEDADKATRSAMRIIRNDASSTLAVWDVRQDCITEHDHRHRLVSQYLRASDPAAEREVAAALRPILEAFMRVAYPATFPPGTLLGQFIGICQKRHGSPDQILNNADANELRALLDYANRFHHDTNPAWQTATINDHELLGFVRRTLAFAQRPSP